MLESATPASVVSPNLPLLASACASPVGPRSDLSALRTDPYERADVTSNSYYDWFLNHDYIALAGNIVVSEFLTTFKEFPPRQKAASFTIDQAMEKMNSVAGGAGH
jgi:hypothetical protein